MPAPPIERTLTVSGVAVVIALRKKSEAQPVYRADYTLPSGRRLRVSTGQTDLAAANQVLDGMLDTIKADIAKDLRSGATQAHEAAKSDPRIKDLMDWYIDTHLPFMGAKPKTIAKAEQVLRDFEIYARGHHLGRVRQITMTKIQEFAAWKDKETGRTKPMAPKTVHAHVAMIRAWLLAAVDAHKLEVSPVRKWLLPRLQRTDVQALSRPDVLALLEAVATHEPDTWAPIAFAAHTGLSVIDIITLPADAVKADRITRRRTKTGNRVDIPITPPVRAALDAGKAAAIGPSRFAFTHPRTQGPFTEQTLLRAVKRAAASAALPFIPTMKLLRASYGTWLAENGCSPKLLAELMGHSDPAMTFKYYLAADFNRAFEFMTRVMQTTENPAPSGPK